MLTAFNFVCWRCGYLLRIFFNSSVDRPFLQSSLTSYIALVLCFGLLTVRPEDLISWTRDWTCTEK